MVLNRLLVNFCNCKEVDADTVKHDSLLNGQVVVICKSFSSGWHGLLDASPNLE